MGFTVESHTSFLHSFSSQSSALPKTSYSALSTVRQRLPCVLRSQHSELHLHAATSVPTDAGGVPSYTSMRADPLRFWDTHKGLNNLPQDVPTSEHVLLNEPEDELLIGELRLLINAASDRAEMHSILAQQRDNWNKLFQRMLTATIMTACLLSSLDGQEHSLSLVIPALLLNIGSAAMMAVINQFQPSQLAEEQRTASRLCRKLASDIHYALQVAPHLRQHVPSLFRDCKRRLQALDKAFPMPLTPGGLEKFPAKVVPPVLIEPISTPSTSCENEHHISLDSDIKGWDRHNIRDLQEVANMLRRSDIPKYSGWAQNLVKINKCFAVAAPLLATSAALLNATAITATAALPNSLGMWAAICSVLAAFVGSFSHDMQLGMVFELYRNSAGYYADVEASISETLDAPVQERENGILFRQRVAYELGRWPDVPPEASLSRLVPADAEEAGTLF